MSNKLYFHYLLLYLQLLVFHLLLSIYLFVLQLQLITAKSSNDKCNGWQLRHVDDKMNINRYIYLKFNIISFRTSTTTNKECKLVVVVREN